METQNNLKELPRFRLAGVPFHSLTMADTLDIFQSAIQTREKIRHCVINAAKVVKAQTDKELHQSIEESNLINVDGQAVVWAGRFNGVSIPERVAGIDLMWALLNISVKKNYRIYFLGATDEVLSLLRERLKREMPTLLIAGYHNGYFEKAEERVAEIQKSKPDILFLGMPTPKKENFIREYSEILDAPVIIGVGGSFDVLAGKVKRAPQWMQQVGLEWFYRMAQEPRRLFKRYATTNAEFIRLALKERFSQ